MERRWTYHRVNSETQRRTCVGARSLVLWSLENLSFFLAKFKDGLSVWFRYIQWRRSSINVPKYPSLRWPTTSLVALIILKLMVYMVTSLSSLISKSIKSRLLLLE